MIKDQAHEEGEHGQDEQASHEERNTHLIQVSPGDEGIWGSYISPRQERNGGDHQQRQDYQRDLNRWSVNPSHES